MSLLQLRSIPNEGENGKPSYLSFGLFDGDKLIRILDDADLKDIRQQWNLHLKKNATKIAKAMATGRSLGEVLQ